MHRVTDYFAFRYVTFDYGTMNRSLDGIMELNSNMTMAVLPVTVFIGVEAVFGFVGNILILLVYSRHYEKSNFRCFVLFMAVLDLTSCCTTLPGEIYSQMNWYTYQYGWLCRIKSFLNVITAWSSAAVLLLLSVDRNRKICHPLKWQMLPKLARKLCWISVMLSLLAAAPILLLWGKQTYAMDIEGYNYTVSICEKSEQFAFSIYPTIYIGCVYILFIGLMFVATVILNVTTSIKLFGHGNENNDFERLGLRRNSTSIMSLSTISMKSEPSPTIDDYLRNGNKKNKYSFHTCSSIANGINEMGGKPRDSEVTLEQDMEIENSKKSERSVGFNTTDETIEEEIMNVKSLYNLTNSDRLTLPSISENNNCFVNQLGASIKQRRLGSTKRKTIIMLVLTSVFVITMTIYIVLTFLVAGQEGTLKKLSNSNKVLFFFFWRLYFINTNINPILYGLMDPRFRVGLQELVKRRYWCAGSTVS